MKQWILGALAFVFVLLVLTPSTFAVTWTITSDDGTVLTVEQKNDRTASWQPDEICSGALTYINDSGPLSSSQFDAFVVYCDGQTPIERHFIGSVFSTNKITGTYSDSVGGKSGNFTMTNGVISSVNTGLNDFISLKQSISQLLDDFLLKDLDEITAPGFSGGANASIGQDYSIIEVPVWYRFENSFAVGAVIPVVWTDGGFHLWDISGLARHLYGSLKDENYLLSSKLQFSIPTGDKEVGAGAGGAKLQQSLIYKLDEAKLLASYSYETFGEVDKLQTGDSFSLFFGGSKPVGAFLPVLGDNYTGYGMIAYSQKQESTFDGTGLNNSRELADFSAGLKYQPLAFKMGVTLPVYTKSDSITNADRNYSIDLGWTF